MIASSRSLVLAASHATSVAASALRLRRASSLRVPVRRHSFASVSKHLSLLHVDVEPPPKDAEPPPKTPEPSKSDCPNDPPKPAEDHEASSPPEHPTDEVIAQAEQSEGSSALEDQVEGSPTPTEVAKKPLVVMLPWMLAQPRQVLKYTPFYTDQGFDVLSVALQPWELLLPERGVQLVVAELLEYLLSHEAYDPLMVHGFSVGGYLWGEVCGKVLDSGERFTPVMRRFVGQVWESSVDVNEIPFGLSSALFPSNERLREAFQGYIEYHMRSFHETSTKHYLRAGERFRANLLKAPALLIVCKNDPISSEKNNLRLREIFVEQGITTYYKCWDESAHVQHYLQHPEEYAAELNCFLNFLGLVTRPDRIRDKLGTHGTAGP